MKLHLAIVFLVIFTIYGSTSGKVLTEGYNVTWSIDGDDIIFEVEVQTLGFIGLGISWQGKMLDADIFIMGVRNGEPYLEDRHGIGNMMPVLDESQDLKLIDSRETDTHTYIKFSRKIHTCDEHDIDITDDTARIIFSWGPTDELDYHGENRGVASINFIDGIPSLPDLSKFQIWNVTNRITMPEQDTTYWCKFVLAPQLSQKHHIIGYEVFRDGSPENVAHTHHSDLLRCIPPAGMDPDELYAEYAAGNGGHCYEHEYVPREYCETLEFSWATGGEITMFPENVGVPFGIGEKTYYMLEVHYDNPNMVKDKTFETGLKFYYTDQVREFDAGFVKIKKETRFNLMVPPNTADFLTPGHCPSECTKAILPEKGINVFNVRVHAHLSARRMRSRLFRDGVELPWIVSDNYYDFNYQQNKMLKEEVTILPGDHITTECTFDSNWKNGGITIGGLSSSDEMCMTILLYYPLVEGFENCLSNYPTRKLLDFFGIEEIEWGSTVYHDPLVAKPEHMKGLKFSQVAQNFSWTEELIDGLREEYLNSDKEVTCSAFPPDSFLTNYPTVQNIYSPEPIVCGGNSSFGQTSFFLIFISIICAFRFII